jgi:hypothetical protein
MMFLASCRELRTFKNPARQDGLELRHWEKASEDPNAGMFSLSTLSLYEVSNVIIRIPLREIQHSVNAIYLFTR